jgi:dTDP-4-dehydrorhamnose 3,5-epimerase
MPFEFIRSEINDVILIKPKAFFDERGFFLELFKGTEFRKNGIVENFVQDNYSCSRQNVLRGLHYQTEPQSQGKLVTVLYGRIFDVVVDLRVKSATFKKWIAFDLNHENKNMLYIPPGLAHGFLSLSEEVHFLYKCTKEYSFSHEKGIRWNDPDLAISWPIDAPVVSTKDQELLLLKDAVFFT